MRRFDRVVGHQQQGHPALAFKPFPPALLANADPDAATAPTAAHTALWSGYTPPPGHTASAAASAASAAESALTLASLTPSRLTANLSEAGGAPATLALMDGWAAASAAAAYAHAAAAAGAHVAPPKTPKSESPSSLGLASRCLDVGPWGSKAATAANGASPAKRRSLGGSSAETPTDRKQEHAVK